MNADWGQQAAGAGAGNRHGAVAPEPWIHRPDPGASAPVITAARTRWRQWMKWPAAVGFNAWTAVAIVHAPGVWTRRGAPSAKSPGVMTGEWDAGEACCLRRILHEKVCALCNNVNSGHMLTFVLLLWIHQNELERLIDSYWSVNIQAYKYIICIWTDILCTDMYTAHQLLKMISLYIHIIYIINWSFR